MRLKVLLFDNYDSFTYNLYHLLKETRPDYDYFIRRNRDETILDLLFDVLIISPGPMRPEDTGLLKTLFDQIVVPQKKPALGICLGMQFIASYYRQSITKSAIAVHGSRVQIIHKGENLFSGLESPFSGARYNSLEVKLPLISPDIEILAEEEFTQSIMALRHKELPFAGVQFHPESFLTINGYRIIDNFFKHYVEI